MEDLKKFIDILNPFEWLKQSYHIPLGIKIAILIVCLSTIIFLPTEIKGINLKTLHATCYWLSAIQLVYILGYFIQQPLDKKVKEKLLIEQKQKKEIEQQNKIKLEKKKKNDFFKLLNTFDYEEQKI